MTLKNPALAVRGLTAAVVVAATVAIGSLAAAPAEAATTSCGSGVCTVYLNKAESASLANGRVPNLKLGAFTAPYLAAAYGHITIAKLWVNRGNCIAFTLNVRPWATQGMTGWRC